MNDFIASRVSELKHQLRKIEEEVLRTPTGPVRNDLADAAIHLRAAIDLMAKE